MYQGNSSRTVLTRSSICRGAAGAPASLRALRPSSRMALRSLGGAAWTHGRCSRSTRCLAISFALGQRKARRRRGRRRLGDASSARALQAGDVVSGPLRRVTSAVPVATFSGACAQGAWSSGVLRVRRGARRAEAIIRWCLRAEEFDKLQQVGCERNGSKDGFLTRCINRVYFISLSFISSKPAQSTIHRRKVG